MIDDVDVRGDRMRAFLKDNSARIGVTPDILLQRINLRLSPVAQQTPLEKSYNTALQTFFESRDQDKYPAYLNEDGTPMGDRAKWDIWNGQIADMGLSTARVRGMAARVEPGARQQREQDLLKSPYWTDYSAGSASGVARPSAAGLRERQRDARL